MKLIDLTGKKYNHLTVVRRVENSENGVARWECLCDCGNTTIVRGKNLKNGSVKSCGCLRKICKNKTHGMTRTRLYREWRGIRTRCNAKGDMGKYYHHRGITVCKEWDESFEKFMEWSLLNGYRDDLTIERIDNNKGYCPENCKWIPKSEQSENRRSCVWVTHNGKTKNLMQWCEEYNVPYKLVHNRMYKLNWSFERAISTPCDISKRNKKEGDSNSGVY